ncbi:MAG TPA: terminase small subunit [Bryobacteraceae bacterium]|nr:terminase small subunit [Bryobacteraceae bacterium]
MGVLKNPRHEKFCQELAKGKSATEAYEAAGYKGDRGHASRLAANGNILARLDELQSRSAERAIVTVESLISEAEAARKLAMEIQQPSAAVSAIREKGVLSGKRVERTEQGVPGEFADIDAMTEDERRAYFAREMAALRVFDKEGDGGFSEESIGEGMPEAGDIVH